MWCHCCTSVTGSQYGMKYVHMCMSHRCATVCAIPSHVLVRWRRTRTHTHARADLLPSYVTFKWLSWAYKYACLYGDVTGTGICVIFLSSVIAVSLYFDKKRAIATGIATSGSGVGVFVYANVCDMLLQHFTWRETVLLLGAFLLHCLACGLVFRPLASARLSHRKRKTCGREGGRKQGGDSQELYDYVEEEDAKTADVGMTKMKESGDVEDGDISSGVTNKSTGNNGLGTDGGGGDLASGKKSPVTIPAPLQPLLQKKTNLNGKQHHQVGNQRRSVCLASLVTCGVRCGQRIRSIFAVHLFSNKAFLFLLVTFSMWTGN